jgi:uncharacterized protein YhdP
VYKGANVRLMRSADDPAVSALRVDAPSLGLLTGTVVPEAKGIVLSDLHLKKPALKGAGSLQCADDLASCHAEFTLDSTDVATSLADLGFRPDLSAARGSLSGEIAWQPQPDAPWLKSATGTLTMRFDDGVARRAESSPGRPLALLVVPALLNSRTEAGGAALSASDVAADSGELKFKRLDAHFELHDGQATTSDLHFDGDAEILVRGRTDLLARDYDHEAWVLRGEERLPASLRRLASAPRVAAAWLTLRELIGGDSSDRSRIVLRLRGSWDEPVITVE